MEISKPKCLLEVGRESILKRQLRLLRQEGIKGVVLVIGAKGSVWSQDAYDQIRKESMGKTDILVNFNNNLTANSYSLYLALREGVEEKVLAIDGDLVFSKRTLANLLKGGKSTLLTKKCSDLSELGNRVLVEGGRVTAVGRHLIPKGLFFIYSGMMKVIEEDLFNMEEALKKFLEEDIGHPLNVFCKKTDVLNCSSWEWVNVNTREDYRRALDCLGSW